MLQLNNHNIKLKSIPNNKIDAIQQVGTLLVETGYMRPEYITSMLEREKVANTYLGNGIAIPHGLPTDREMILKTGIAVLQVPAGVEWNPGEIVHLVVGIAAKSDEHIEILTNLTHVLADEAAVQQLATTTDPNDIIERLSGQKSSPAQANPDNSQPNFAHAVDVTLPGKLGLHARPATALVNLAKSFHSEIRVRYRNETANAKSLISLLKLGVEGGQTIRVMAEGSDEQQALATLEAAIRAGLEDEPEVASEKKPAQRFNFETAPIVGIGASPGLAVAPVYQLKQRQLVVEADAADSQAETARLQQAIATAKLQLQDLYETVKAKAGAAEAGIFQAHQEFLDDPELQQAAFEQIQHHHSAAWSWQQTYQQRAATLAQLADPLLAGRAADLRDVGERVLRLLVNPAESGDSSDAVQFPAQPFILIAEDLTPSDTAGLDPSLVLGFCTAYGGPTSHSAIIARSLDIPAIVGAGIAALNLANGTRCILDGEAGHLYANPSEADLTTASAAQTNLQAIREAEKLTCYQPALTTDGHRIEVVANIGAAAEAEQAVNAGAEGIGLLRTEFLFLNRSQPPTEAEQVAAYTEMTKALNGLPLIIRTLDIGGDKAVPYLNLPAEANPFLGVRGIRLCFQQPELFKTQLRAIFQAARTGPIKIMFPMIANLAEFKQARQIAESVRLDIGADPIDYGMMVEVPSAVMLAAAFAEEVQFFSIGTNDLTQYTLAMDRGHPALAKQADGLHPAVLRMIDQTVQAAQTRGKWVGVCGGVAGEPLGAAILTGLGVTELSVSIPSVATVKAKLRSLSLSQAQELAERALKCSSAEEVRGLRNLLDPK
jgi:phosphocarrier protein FPr